MVTVGGSPRQIEQLCERDVQGRYNRPDVLQADVSHHAFDAADVRAVQL